MHTWNASFISTDRPSGPEDPAVYFRRDFDAPTRPVRATLRVVQSGDHAWRYALPAGHGSRKTFTLDTSMKDIVDDVVVWDAVAKVFQTHYPSMPIGAVSAHIGDIPLRSAIERLPNPSPTLEAELLEALG